MATNISEFSKRVQADVIGCPRAVVDTVVVDTIIRFCEDTYIIEKAFEHDVVAADITAADNDSVNVNIATYVTNIRPLVVTEFKIDGATWETSEIQLLNDLDDISEISVEGTKFFCYPDRTHIKFYDIEAVDQRFYIKQAFAPVTSITTIDDFIYDRWHEAIEAGAKGKLMAMPKKDWTDPVMASYNLSLYTDGVARAKITSGQGYTKGSKRPKSMRFF